MRKYDIFHFDFYYLTIVFITSWIPLFIHEIRKKDGGLYRAKTLFEYILSIQSLIRVEKNVVYEFLKKSQFLPIKNALNNRMRFLQSNGLGFNPKKVDIVTRIMEEELWSCGHLGDSCPKMLLQTLVFLLGINLGLRAGEHRLLRRPMFKVSLKEKKEAIFVVYHFNILKQIYEDDSRFTFIEWASKNNPGGIRHVNHKPKVVTVFAGKDPQRCPVRLLKKYFSMT